MGPKRRLSPEQIVALNIYRFHFKIGDLKNYHKMVKELMHDKVPELTNYENFLKATNKSAIFILSFMSFLMRMNKMCRICSEKGEPENIIFSHANVAGCKIAEKLCECVEGTFFADAGYLQRKDILKHMENNGIRFEAASRKNMSRLMNGLKCYHIKHRSIIESEWETLKNNFCLEYHKARCTAGMFRHFFYSTVAYMLNRNLNYYDNFFRSQLA